MADIPQATPPTSSSKPPSDPAPGHDDATRGGFAGIVAVMRQAGFRDYTLGSMVSVVGVWLQRVATGWLAWELTEAPSWLGIITFTDLFVMMLLAPLWGVISDRMDRLRLLHIAQFLLFTQAVAIAVFYGLGWMRIELLLALTVYMGIGHAAHGAARLALLPNLVPKELLSQAIAVNALTFNIARFLGPAVAGVVIAGWGLTPAFAINATTYVVFSLLLLRVRITTPDKPLRPKGGVLSQMAEGYRYATRHGGIGPMLIMMLVTAFTIRALPDLLPAFAAKVFGGDVHELAWLTSALGLGAMIGGLKMAHRRSTRGLTRLVIWNVAFLAVAVSALAATEMFWLGVAATVACGYVLTVNGTGTQTLIQSAVDGALRGRVMAVFTLIYQGAPAVGALLLGTLADHFGMRWPFMGGAFLCLLMWVWMVRRAGPIEAALEGGIPTAHGPTAHGPTAHGGRH